MNAALELKGIVKCYGKLRALDGLDLNVPRGSIFGLVGSNGAGKTTAMAVATGLLASAQGTVNLFGEGAFRAEKHAGRITLLPQDSRFSPHSRVEDVLRFYAQLQSIPAGEIEKNISELLDWVHLQDRRRSAVRTLSHGMCRRLSIAQAFLGSPELVLLDEPLNGLDPREAARVRELIRERRGRQAIVISSHQLTDIEILCDNVAFIEKGRLVRQDTLEKITRRSHRITYMFSNGLFPLPQLSAVLPEVQWEMGEGRAVATFPAQYTTEEMNARVLPVLLTAGVGVLEIQRGSDLESEYFRLANG